MSQYTVELRTIMESKYDLEEHLGYEQINSFLDSHANEFMPNYPIWDESYRLVLNKLILKHFWTRQIGLETPGRFMLALDTKLNVIMPYYNRLMLADDLLKKYMAQYGLRDNITERDSVRHNNDIGNANITSNDINNQESDRHSDTVNNRIADNKRDNIRNNNSHIDNHTNNIGTNTDNNHSDRIEYQLYSDTPQSGIDGIEGNANGNGTTIDGMYYLTNATKNYGNENSKGKSQSEQSSNGTTDTSDDEIINETQKSKEQQNSLLNENSNNKNESIGKRKEQRENTSVEEYLENVKQYVDFPAKKLIELGDEIFEINNAILKKLEPLFLQIWDDNDSSVTHPYFGYYYWR